MAYSLGGVVSVSYVITRDGEELPSETLTLTVQDLPQSALIAPRLKEADADGEGAELKLANLTPEGKMWCPGFPLIAEGQFVWLLFKGTNANGKPYQEYIWAPTSAFVNAQWVKEGFFEAFAPYGDLIGLQDGSSLTIEMFIAFGKSEELALAKRFLIRSYRVSAVDESLSVDTSPVVLSGRNYTVDLAAVRWELTGNDLPGTVVTREATGGKPPYTYTSSAPEIVSVDTTGRIRSVWNGMAKIIVSDTSGKSLEIPVQSSNVQQILSGGDNLSDAAAMAWMQRVGGTPFHQNLGMI
ncbi:hypothetical protein LJU32_17775 [Pseudomonas sp. B21_DOA]|nr:hypothetical protein LJU32_17775 [Pseudomonas sp. B21_DOA]